MQSRTRAGTINSCMLSDVESTWSSRLPKRTALMAHVSGDIRLALAADRYPRNQDPDRSAADCIATIAGVFPFRDSGPGLEYGARYQGVV